MAKISARGNHEVKRDKAGRHLLRSDGTILVKYGTKWIKHMEFPTLERATAEFDRRYS